MRAAVFALSWVLSAAASQAEPTTAPAAVRPWPCRLVVEDTLLSAILDAWQTIADPPAAVSHARRRTRSCPPSSGGNRIRTREAATRLGTRSKAGSSWRSSRFRRSPRLSSSSRTRWSTSSSVSRDGISRVRHAGADRVCGNAFRGGFESQRAIDVGRQVAREVEESRRRGIVRE